MELLTLEEVMAVCRMTRDAIRRGRQDGSFPQPVRVSTRSVRWRRSDIDAWIESLPEAVAAAE